MSTEVTIESEAPALINVARCGADACTCAAGSNPIGHRGLWGVTPEEARSAGLRVGRRVDFTVYFGDVIASGVVTEMLTAERAEAEIGGKVCSGVNSVWFRWEPAGVAVD